MEHMGSKFVKMLRIVLAVSSGHVILHYVRAHVTAIQLIPLVKTLIEKEEMGEGVGMEVKLGGSGGAC